MKALRSLLCAVLAMGLFAVSAGCDSAEESAIKGVVALLNDAADVLEGVKSKDDVPDAKEELNAIGKKMKEHNEGMKKVEKLPQAERDALHKKYEPEMKKATDRMQKEMERITTSVGIDSMVELSQALGSGFGAPGM